MEEYKEILRRIILHDKSGLEQLYNAYGKQLYSFAIYRWKLDEDSAWEVIYRTLDTLILKLPDYTFESKAHFENFIFKVFTNFLRQNYRSHRKKQMDEAVDTDNLFVDNNDTSKDDPSRNGQFEIDKRAFIEYYRNETFENPKLLALEKALEQLEPQERDLLLLRAQNYSYEEISDMLRIENKQLKVKHHRTKEKVLKLLNVNTQKKHA
jgi:RNA polymerase sigma factor (sigma-70 family)